MTEICAKAAVVFTGLGALTPPRRTSWPISRTHFMIPFGKFGPPYLGKTTAASSKSSATQSYNCMLGVFSRFCNPPNSDMDYRILNVRT